MKDNKEKKKKIKNKFKNKFKNTKIVDPVTTVDAVIGKFSESVPNHPLVENWEQIIDYISDLELKIYNLTEGKNGN